MRGPYRGLVGYTGLTRDHGKEKDEARRLEGLIKISLIKFLAKFLLGSDRTSWVNSRS
jgi:hypothetical protein